MNPFLYLNPLTSLLVILLGISVLYRSRSRVNFIFFVFSLVISLWLFFYFLAYNSNDTRMASFFFKFGYLNIILIPIIWFHFCKSFLQQKNVYLNFVLWSGYITAFCFIALLSGDSLIGSLNKFSWGYYPAASIPLHFAFLFYFNFIFSHAISILLLDILKLSKSVILKSGDRTALTKAKYLFWASLIGTFAAVDFVANYNIDIYPFGFIFMLCFVGIVSYSIVKHRLLDIGLAITRSTIFIAVYSLVLGIPFALAFGMQTRLIDLFGSNWWILPLFSSTLLATIGPFIYLFIEKKAESKILKEQKSYQNILRNASGGMIRIKNLNKLLNLVVHVVTKTVKIAHASIYLLDRENNVYVRQAGRGLNSLGKEFLTIDVGSPLVWHLMTEKKPVVTEEIVMKLRDESQNQALSDLVEQLSMIYAALVIPSFVDDKLIGILVLGEKLSRKLYSEDDLVVFSVLANQAALAIENAQFYDEVKRTHEQLFQAEKMATIGTMADGLSHQINNRFHALSLISGDALDILKTYDLSNCSDETKQVLSDLKGSLERIEANVLQGGEVVKNLLKYSRPGESGFELVDFNDVLNGSIDMVQYKIKLKEVDLVRNIPGDLSKFHGNLTQLQEVFFNLIDNAYDATKEREATLKEEGFRSRIEITAKNVDGSVEIIVSDNGMGVKDLDKKKLFTPFFTTKATAKKGTGLGLYVIDKIITSHNGKISIDSVYQSGTSFTITLPISPKAA